MIDTNNYTMMIDALKEANQEIIDLKNKIDEYKWLEYALIERTRLLDKRDRELNCIYLIIELIKNNKNNYNLIFQLLAENIIQGFQYPDKTSVILQINNNIFTSKNYFKTSIFYSSDIKVKKHNIGILTIYLKSINEKNNTFLSEEIKLIDITSYLLSILIESNKI